MISVAILGHGVVGSGVAEVLMQNAETVMRNAGDTLVVKRILDLRSFPDLPYADLFTTDFNTILQDDDIRIVVETMGGLNPAFEFVSACLSAGKHVVTSNKELVAAKGDVLLALAEEKGVNFLFEASVGGGIPLLRPLDRCLSANNIEEIAGILNGTTNFMLTQMVQNGMTFDDALKLAQDLGYAERNPSADVDGHDTCRKVCILAALAYGKHVYPDQVHTEGISNVTLEDVRCAAAIGRKVKLIGKIRRVGARVECLVAPHLVSDDNLLSSVNDVFNAVAVRGDAVGDVMFYGRGAGKLPTASAVVADVIDEARHLVHRKPLGWAAGSPDYVTDYEDSESAVLLRFTTADKQALLHRAETALGAVTVVSYDGAPSNELALVTDVFTVRELQTRLAALGEQPLSCLRLL